MQSFNHRRVLLKFLLVLGLLSSCRSERVAFRFQTQDSWYQDGLAGELSVPDEKRVNEVVDAKALVITKPPARARRVPVRMSGGKKTLEPKRAVLVLPARRPNTTIGHSTAKATTDPSYGGFLFFGGLALCAAAIIIGINLGGFLGLTTGTVMFFSGSLLGALGFAGPDKPDPDRPKSETGLRPYVTLLFGLLATVLLVGGGLGLLLHGGPSYLAATLTGAAMFVSASLFKWLKSHSASNSH